MRPKLIFIWCGAFEAHLDLIRVFTGRQTRAVRHTENMGINSDSRLAKCLIEDDIGCLATHTRQSHEFVAGLWDLTAKIIKQHLAERDDILGFVTPEADCLDVLLDASEAEFEHSLRCVSDFEQARRCLVDADIGGLR